VAKRRGDVGEPPRGRGGGGGPSVYIGRLCQGEFPTSYAL